MPSKQLLDLTGQTAIVTREGSRLESLMETSRVYAGRRRYKLRSMFTSHQGLRESCQRTRSVREISTRPSIGCNRF
ncbi:hypothetical protein BAMA_21060 [Bacillus manliponensis]|uniref:Uncharacterized protein n=1 Tax=Bacillus manliponensis TaxID=574376 RepID=A0A073KBQ0_9BACI|nr:hypothetical protein BAMA_21060 [Bacillus manliponensis]